MSVIEDRLRDAMHARARAVQEEGVVPALPARRRAVRFGWVAPIVVAVAIVALVAGVTVAVRDEPREPVVVTPAATPPFYVGAVVTLGAAGTGSVAERGPLGVYDSGTGRRTAELPVLAESRVAGLGDGRTFFLAGREREAAAIRFYRLTLTPDGRIGRQEALPIPADPRVRGLDALAVSPDGRKLAYSVRSTTDDVRVADVGSGQVRRWRTAKAGVSYRMAWSGESRTLVFSWLDERPVGSETRLLDTTRPGRDLLDGKVVDGRSTFPAVKPGGSTFVTQQGGGRGIPHLVEFSTSTGKQVGERVVKEWFSPTDYDATGRVLLGFVRGGAPARLDGDRPVRIPLSGLPKGKSFEATW
ncbi:hypothetical protein [Nonomuraea sp. NPDC046570]|uniref:hypothetical protein n=1 Tax=Nonomuraea sp. NPDC046570 TaxID=3155255 RepID=UPI00340D4443